MEEITFLDVLTHYQTKIHQLCEELETIRSQLQLSRQTIDESWKGPAAEACKTKVETLYPELNRALSDLSDARLKLGAVADAWEELQATLLPPILEG